MKHLGINVSLRLTAAITCSAFLSGCAMSPHVVNRSPYSPAIKILNEARSSQVPPEKRAADYLEVAAMTAPLIGNGRQTSPARETYNAAVAEVTILLRSNGGGRMWNHPLTLIAKNTTYHLRLEPAASGIWPPEYFTTFKLPSEINEKRIRHVEVQGGVGGTLVGIREAVPREPFAPPRGISAAVTATLEFRGTNATLALHRAAEQRATRGEVSSRPLAANYSAPLAYYTPPANVLLVGLMAALRSGNYMDKTGLYFLQPYDPKRIPVIFVHGLISTPFTWIQTINEIEADPQLRGRYQFWVFAYPTGNPPFYSALRLREELAKVDRVYPDHRGYILVGHSLGGLLSHIQVVSLSRKIWERNLGAPARQIFANNRSDSLIYRALVYQANPRIERVVFICTPHRGSDLATSGLGKFGRALISLPRFLATELRTSLSDVDLSEFTGSTRRLPNSVSGLAPNNPGLKVINESAVRVPYHSIIGDRGKGDSPESTDGVVAYWSSHLDGARSERIVPGPHGSCELPQTIVELRRILHLHLNAQDGRQTDSRSGSQTPVSASSQSISAR